MTPHASKRALTRYGMEMTIADLQALADACREGRGKRLQRNNDADIWAVYWERADRTVPVVYHRKAGRVITVLPKRHLNGRRYHEPDTDWVDVAEDDAFNAEALTDVHFDVLRGEVPNEVMAVKLREAGVVR
jgi:hypothetical protein